jgi:hypothetical protein
MTRWDYQVALLDAISFDVRVGERVFHSPDGTARLERALYAERDYKSDDLVVAISPAVARIVGPSSRRLSFFDAERHRRRTNNPHDSYVWLPHGGGGKMAVYDPSSKKDLRASGALWYGINHADVTEANVYATLMYDHLGQAITIGFFARTVIRTGSEILLRYENPPKEWTTMRTRDDKESKRK